MTDQSTATIGSSIQQRKTKRRWLLWLFVVAISALLLIALAVPHGVWDGRAQRTIRVHVASNDTGSPLRDATVTLIQSRDRMMLEAEELRRNHHLATTDERGEATVLGQFGAGGPVTLFGHRGSFDADGLLRVSHPRFRTSEDLLANYLGRRKFPLRTKNPLDVYIFLAPN